MPKYGPPITQHHDNKLDDFLNSSNVKETEAMKAKRAQVLAELAEIVKRWIVEVAAAHSISDSEANAEIFPFGSYGFDAYGPGSDIDVLCVGPNYASRELDFFETLYKIFTEIPQVTQILKIPNAYVPIMKFKFDQIAIDMVYASIGLNIVPHDLDLLRAESVLKGSILDKKTMLSINGYRNTEKIKQIVNGNIESFRMALHSLKLWARCRVIYSNVSGFLGGINLAILLCHVCLHNPYASASWLLWTLFRIFSNWTWPSPVRISDEKVSVSPYFSPEWEWGPRNDQVEKIDLMPMITPATPHCSNAANSVCASSFAIMKQEFKIGKDKCQDIIMRNSDWGALFEPYLFFKAYRHYFEIELKSTNPDDLRLWKGYVVSRLRYLVLDLEKLTQLRWHGHINPKCFKDPEDSNRCFYFVGIRRNKKLEMQGDNKLDLTRLIYDFRHRLTLKYDNWKCGAMDIYITIVDEQSIPLFALKTESPKRKRFGDDRREDEESKRVAREKDNRPTSPIRDQFLIKEFTIAEKKQKKREKQIRKIENKNKNAKKNKESTSLHERRRL